MANMIHKPRRLSISLPKILLYSFLILGCLVTLVPFIWTILASFKTHAEIIDVSQRSFFPRNFTTENYETIFNDKTLPLGRFYFNSAFIAITNTVLLSFTSSVFGFVFAKYEFPLKKILFGYILLTMMIPFQLTMIPSYLILVKLNLTNRLIGMVALSWFDAFGIFILTQFIKTIPNELLDSARIDGASEWTLYWRIILPQITPALATIGIITFISNWNAYLWPLIVLRSLEVRTLPIILTWFNDQHSSNQGLQMAASVLLVMPMLVVYLALQRWVVRGFTLSGLKG